MNLNTITFPPIKHLGVLKFSRLSRRHIKVICKTEYAKQVIEKTYILRNKSCANKERSTDHIEANKEKFHTCHSIKKESIYI